MPYSDRPTHAGNGWRFVEKDELHEPSSEWHISYATNRQPIEWYDPVNHVWKKATSLALKSPHTYRTKLTREQFAEFKANSRR